MTALERAVWIKRLAIEAGFDECGISDASPLGQGEYYQTWIGAGRHGSMGYLERHAAMRENPALLLEGARSVVCVLLNYRREDAPPAEGTGAWGRVARYARGVDYHIVVAAKLERMIARMRETADEPFAARRCVDTAPLLERQLAARAGLGWIGRNTLLLHPRLGSYTFLGEIVTTLEIAADAPISDHCGSCRACLDACPTAAFPAPYEMDASRCISYLTIEHRGEIAAELRAKMGDWVYGCDVCQEVCPFNRKPPLGSDPQLSALRAPAYLELRQLKELRAGEYRRLTRESAAKRASAAMWRRNAEIALANRRSGASDQPRT
ncbi:MAG: tRNA epoxyqueuosine(34) reductase QueG [Phycisphaerae bacterium]|nr:tRNA epoxyqueuosine(34) reductase QueG [Phycisphaerae bacterium]